MNRYYARLQDPDTVYELAHDLFLAGSITCFLYALHRIARGLTLTARVKALDEFEDAYEPEEREALMHKIKASSLHC
ncbi:MAG: hypothetical protein ACYCXR_09815 [Coriobacteriia bacterium]